MLTMNIFSCIQQSPHVRAPFRRNSKSKASSTAPRKEVLSIRPRLLNYKQRQQKLEGLIRKNELLSSNYISRLSYFKVVPDERYKSRLTFSAQKKKRLITTSRSKSPLRTQPVEPGTVRSVRAVKTFLVEDLSGWQMLREEGGWVRQ